MSNRITAKVIITLSTLLVLALEGCGSGGGGTGAGTEPANTNNPTNPTNSSPSTYGVSGTVTSAGAGMPGVTITLTTGGPTNPATVTDANGHFTFTGLANGQYTLTPSETGASFSPTNMTIAINGSDLTGNNFTGALGFSISGLITFVTGINAKQAVELTLSGPSSVVANPDANGNYSFIGLANGVYTVTASMPNYTSPFVPGHIPACGTLMYSLSPSQMTVTIDNANSAAPVVKETYGPYQGSCPH